MCVCTLHMWNIIHCLPPLSFLSHSHTHSLLSPMRTLYIICCIHTPLHTHTLPLTHTHYLSLAHMLTHSPTQTHSPPSLSPSLPLSPTLSPPLSQEVISMIKTTKVPIICICNDRQHPKIRSLSNHCYDLRFPRPRVDQIRGAMMSICFKVGAKTVNNVVNNVVNNNKYMYSKCII